MNLLKRIVAIFCIGFCLSLLSCALPAPLATTCEAGEVLVQEVVLQELRQEIALQKEISRRLRESNERQVKELEELRRELSDCRLKLTAAEAYSTSSMQALNEANAYLTKYSQEVKEQLKKKDKTAQWLRIGCWSLAAVAVKAVAHNAK